MHNLIFMVVALIFGLISPKTMDAAPKDGSLGARAPEIEAKCWFNPQPVRIHQTPKLILLEFWSARSRESRDFVESMKGFHKAFGDGRLLIVALTEDECEDARHFISREKLEYKVGGGSRSAKDYEIKDLPAVVLIDPKDGRVLNRWSGRELKAKAIAEAIFRIVGAPSGEIGTIADTSQPDRETFDNGVAETDDQLANLISGILAIPGELGPEALSGLNEFYDANLPGEAEDDATRSRVKNYSRSAVMDDAGYPKLVASGRLSASARMAVRDRVLGIAEQDPVGGIRISALGALRKSIGQSGDPELLRRLRGMLERETDPLVRAPIEHALEDLDPKQAATKNTDRTTQPIALRAKRSLGEAPDPASSPWASAYAYRQTVAGRSPEELLQDYWASPEPPIEDSVEIENAALKRDAAMGELNKRIARGEVSDLTGIKDHFARALSEEPDPYIRKYIAWSGLRAIAEKEGSAVRAEIIQLFEKRLPEEPDRYVRSSLEVAITELKAKP